MSFDRRLIDSIKKHMAGKSTAQLQDLIRTEDRENWSEEAFAAAREVLLDRSEGRAHAPLVPVEDRPPPSKDDILDSLFSLATICTTGVLGCGIILTPVERDPDDDLNSVPE